MLKLLGIIAVRRKGNASPNPMKKKIRKMVDELVVKAKVRAVPRNGAEHGVERIVVRTPPKKSPAIPSSVCALPSLDPPGVKNSKRPKRFRLKIKRINIIAKIKTGDCSWKPQPTSSPVALIATMIPAKAMKVDITPEA